MSRHARENIDPRKESKLFSNKKSKKYSNSEEKQESFEAAKKRD